MVKRILGDERAGVYSTSRQYDDVLYANHIGLLEQMERGQ